MHACMNIPPPPHTHAQSWCVNDSYLTGRLQTRTRSLQPSTRFKQTRRPVELCYQIILWKDTWNQGSIHGQNFHTKTNKLLQRYLSCNQSKSMLSGAHRAAGLPILLSTYTDLKSSQERWQQEHCKVGHNMPISSDRKRKNEHGKFHMLIASSKITLLVLRWVPVPSLIQLYDSSYSYGVMALKVIFDSCTQRP